MVSSASSTVSPRKTFVKIWYLGGQDASQSTYLAHLFWTCPTIRRPDLLHVTILLVTSQTENTSHESDMLNECWVVVIAALGSWTRCSVWAIFTWWIPGRKKVNIVQHYVCVAWISREKYLQFTKMILLHAPCSLRLVLRCSLETLDIRLGFLHWSNFHKWHNNKSVSHCWVRISSLCHLWGRTTFTWLESTMSCIAWRQHGRFCPHT